MTLACADAVIQSLGDAAWLVDGARLEVVAANVAAARLLGVADVPLLVGRRADDMLCTLEDAAYWDRVRAGDRPVLHSMTEWTGADGRPRQLSRSIKPLQVGGAQAFVVVAADHTAQVLAEREREALVADLGATLEATADGILVTDLEGRVRAFNRRFASLWQLPESLLHPGQDAALREWMHNSVAEPAAYVRRLEQIEAQTMLAATDTVQLFSGVVLERYTQPQLRRGEPIGRVYSFRSAQRSSSPDVPSAGAGALPNRPGFVRQVNEALVHARRGGGAVAVLAIEFDGRAVYGVDGSRLDSERVWNDVAEALRACVRQPDIVARIGSARFAVLAHHIGEAGAETLARRILGTLSRRLVRDESLGKVPVSVGVALYPDAGTTGGELLDHAQTALQMAQASAGEAYRIYRAADDPARREDRVKDALRRALRDSRLRVQFQPCVHLATGAVIGAEALLRWRDPALGEVAPARIVAAAESAGLMVGIDEWVLEQSLRHALQWPVRGEPVRVSVNVAPVTFLRPAFPRRVRALLQATGMPAARLDIEIREAALLADARAGQEAIAELAQLGVGIVLDDYGRGDSNLGHLRDRRVRAIKIDRSLVRDVPHNAVHASLVEGIVLMARALRVEVVAKGIETDDQRRFFRDIGCAVGQGFHFGSALPNELFEQRLPALAA